MYTLLEEFPRKIVFAIAPRLMPSTVFAIVATQREQFDQSAQRLQATLVESFRRHKGRHILKVVEERGRDWLGCSWAAERTGVVFFDPGQGGGYR